LQNASTNAFSPLFGQQLTALSAASCVLSWMHFLHGSRLPRWPGHTLSSTARHCGEGPEPGGGGGGEGPGGVGGGGGGGAGLGGRLRQFADGESPTARPLANSQI
jgi:hypothetical protein